MNFDLNEMMEPPKSSQKSNSRKERVAKDTSACCIADKKLCNYSNLFLIVTTFMGIILSFIIKNHYHSIPVTIKSDVIIFETNVADNGLAVKIPFVPDFNRIKNEQLLGILKGLNFEENSFGVNGTKTKLTAEEKILDNATFSENYFSLVTSDKVSLNRELTDRRPKECVERAKSYGPMSPASIIIVFHNEAFSTLIRSIHSIINRTNFKRIVEIILVDDASDKAFLISPLSDYIKLLPIKMHLIRLNERSGLVRARLEGSKLASGTNLVFLDSHIEVTKGWIEPLLVDLDDKQFRIVSPIVDVIGHTNLEYQQSIEGLNGGFDWYLSFIWQAVSYQDFEKRDISENIPTPTIAGGLFAVNRLLFWEYGSYDSAMKIWSGENLEMSFRAWMCGGRLDISPCSRVGHIFRDKSPYTFPGGVNEVIYTNLKRVAEVWMDEYKEFFYKYVEYAKTLDAGDMEERKEFRKRKNCKSFKWYLQNVVPEGNIPFDFVSLGTVKLASENTCLSLDKDDGEGKVVLAESCDENRRGQIWTLNKRGVLRQHKMCLTFINIQSDSFVETQSYACGYAHEETHQFFDYNPQSRQIIHRESGKCMSIYNEKIGFEPCSESNRFQHWLFEGYRNE